MKKKNDLKKKYSFKNYKANKNCVSIEYKGKVYLSKTQCMVLNNLKRGELDEYIKEREVNVELRKDDEIHYKNILN